MTPLVKLTPNTKLIEAQITRPPQLAKKTFKFQYSWIAMAAWLVPIMTLPVATAFIVTYLYSFVVKGQQWLRQRHQ